MYRYKLTGPYVFYLFNMLHLQPMNGMYNGTMMNKTTNYTPRPWQQSQHPQHLGARSDNRNPNMNPGIRKPYEVYNKTYEGGANQWQRNNDPNVHGDRQYGNKHPGTGPRFNNAAGQHFAGQPTDNQANSPAGVENKIATTQYDMNKQVYTLDMMMSSSTFG